MTGTSIVRAPPPPSACFKTAMDLRDNLKLTPFILLNVTLTGTRIGAGPLTSFKTVLNLKYLDDYEHYYGDIAGLAELEGGPHRAGY